MKVDLIIKSATQLLTLTGGIQRGADLGKLGLIKDGAVVINDGEIIAVGSSAKLQKQYQASETLDAIGKIVRIRTWKDNSSE